MQNLKHYNMTKEIIQQIKTLFTIGKKIQVIECGCAAVVSNTLLSIPGASSFIDSCSQLYSKESQVAILGKDIKRSVSKEMIEALLETNSFDKIVLSFQLSDRISLSHGWIGIKTNGINYTYHMSINKNLHFGDETINNYDERQWFLNEILKATLNILTYHYIDNTQLPINNWIDYADENILFDILGKSTQIDQFAVYDNGWKRMEDFVRGNDGIILMRGSFNPPHAGHLALLEKAILKYPDYKPAFLVSLNRRDKPILTKDECLQKLELLKFYGYPVIFSSFPFFFDTMESFSQRWSQEVIFPVGMDTINRFVEDSNKDVVRSVFKCHSLNFKFLVFDRQGQESVDYSSYTKVIEFDDTYHDNGISSTKIRNGEWI
jgi:nicotinic acid mononucleotide adenylyltransferase